MASCRQCQTSAFALTGYSPAVFFDSLLFICLRGGATGVIRALASCQCLLAIFLVVSGLADGVSQGNANGQEFRSAPLWGVGQRIFFLHDGRTDDLLQAIRSHASAGSEANSVINNFNMLGQGSKQDLVNYLRSL